MGLAPLHADSWIQVVQLAGAQGNGLGGFHMLMLPKGSNLFLLLPYSRACLFSGSQASPAVPIAWEVMFNKIIQN